MNSQKVFVILVIIAIVAIFAISGGFFVTKNKKVEAPVVVSLNTYTNDKYGFSLEFPDSWKNFIVQDNLNEIKFCVKNLYPLSKKVSDYSCLYKIMIVDRKTWEVEATPCLKDINSQTMCDWVDSVVGKNDKYVFSGIVAVQDYNDVEYSFIQDTKKIVFKLAKASVSTTTPIIGGDKDSHGCIGSAGYSWCEVKNKCLRVWEEKCEAVLTATTTDEIKDWKIYKNEEYGFEFKYSNDWEIDEDKGYITVFNPATIEVNKPDTDQFREAVVFTLTEKTCTDSNWKIGFGLIYYKTFCVKKDSSTVSIDMGAFTDKTKNIEDKIVSTFKFTK
jgi:hypothetical protein